MHLAAIQLRLKVNVENNITKDYRNIFMYDQMFQIRLIDNLIFNSDTCMLHSIMH